MDYRYHEFQMYPMTKDWPTSCDQPSIYIRTSLSIISIVGRKGGVSPLFEQILILIYDSDSESVSEKKRIL